MGPYKATEGSLGRGGLETCYISYVFGIFLFFSSYWLNSEWCQTNKQQHKKSGHELLIFVYIFYKSCSTNVMQCGQLSHNIGINTNAISALASVACFHCHFIILMVKLIFIWYRYKIQLPSHCIKMRYKQMTTKKNQEYFIDFCLHILNSCSTNVKQCGQLSPSTLGLTPMLSLSRMWCVLVW
jgi:hypothetical protein